MSIFVRLSAFLVSLLLALPASAAQRTFVASFGLDANTCQVTAPCRTFTRALTQTDVEGEVIVLDSAGYGAFTISQSVSIIAPDGVYAGISVFPGQDGVTVNAVGTSSVILRGLHINNQGGDDGIRIHSARSVHIENCVITGMRWGIILEPTVKVSVVVHDTTVRRSSLGFAAQGVNAAGAFSDVRISRSSFSDNSIGVYVSDITRVSISDSVISGNVDTGFRFASTATSTVNPSATVDRVQIVRNGAGLLALATGTVVSVANVSGSVIANNSVRGVYVSQQGAVRLMGSQVTGNGTGVVVDAGGAIASLGDNMVFGNGVDGPAALPVPPY